MAGEAPAPPPTSPEEPRRIRVALVVALLASALLPLWLASNGLVKRFALDTSKAFQRSGHCFVVMLAPPWPFTMEGDTVEAMYASPTQLFEDGQPLGPSHQATVAIETRGNGRLSHWTNELRFSTSDNSDPRTNGRRYEVLVVSGVPWRVAQTAALACVAAAAFVAWPLARRRAARASAAPAVTRPSTGGLAWLGGSLFVALAATWAVTQARGALLWLAAGLVPLALVIAVQRVSGPRIARVLRRVAAIVGATTLALVLAELLVPLLGRVRGSQAAPLPTASAREGVTAPRPTALPLDVQQRMLDRRAIQTMPAEWVQRSEPIGDGCRRVHWLGVEHILDQDGFRRCGPFPPRPPGASRVVVLGDSLTYGWALPEEWSYPAQLQRALEPLGPVEVLNLGVAGHQSADVLAVAREHLAALEPDLVVYGICINDFLPSGQGQYQTGTTWAFPISPELRRWLMERSHLARLADEGYKHLLRRYDLRMDFFEDILSDFDDYQQRFAADLQALAELARSLGLPPVVATVVDQSAQPGGQGHRVGLIAEQAAARAGMTVLPCTPFHESCAGQRLYVSRFDGHPDERAMEIFAWRIADHLIAQGWPPRATVNR